MGTNGEWIRVLCLAVVWGAAMLWFTVRGRAAANIKPKCRITDILLMVPLSVCFGIVVEFKWRAFSSPLAFIMVAALSSACRWDGSGGSDLLYADDGNAVTASRSKRSISQPWRPIAAGSVPSSAVANEAYRAGRRPTLCRGTWRGRRAWLPRPVLRLLPR